MCEKYNGWTNRETWALQLWLTNDQGLYEMTRERVQQCADLIAAESTDEEPCSIIPLDAGETVKAVWEELTDPDEGLMSAESILEMVRDVGSLYRVDWDEIGAAWLEDVAEGDAEGIDREAQYHDFSDGYGQPVTEDES